MTLYESESSFRMEQDENFSQFSCSEAYLELVFECRLVPTQFDSQSVCLDSYSGSFTTVVQENRSIYYMTRGLLL